MQEAVERLDRDNRMRLRIVSLDYIEGRIKQSLQELDHSGLADVSRLAMSLAAILESAQQEIGHLRKAVEDGSIQ